MVVIDPDAKARAHPHSATVIGHRGSYGTRPEHTLASYEQAIQACADFIEPDVVPTKDGTSSPARARDRWHHRCASHPEFAARRVTKVLDGVPVTGWFTRNSPLARVRPCAPSSGCLPSDRRTRRSTGSTPSRPSTRCSTWPATRAPADGGKVASTPRPSTRRTSGPRVCPSTSGCWTRCGPTGWGGQPGLRPELRDHQPQAAGEEDERAARTAGRLRRGAVRPTSTGDPTTYADLVTRAGLRKVSRPPTGSARARTC